MAIKKTSAGWLADLQPGGRGGKRFRKTFKTKADALAWEAWLTTQVNTIPEWQPQRRDTRRLSELVKLWYVHHGANLRAGEDTNARLMAMCATLGDPVADRFNAEMFAEYRAQRQRQGISPGGINREHAYMRAVFNELRRLGLWKKENPLSGVRQIRQVERELSFLTLDQVGALLSKLDDGSDALLVSKVCLATGARWSEAEGLTSAQVRAGAIHFTATKSGRNRSVPISAGFYDALVKQASTRREPRLFSPCYHNFRKAVAAAELRLPEGQLTHVLRHTFASHFMMKRGEHHCPAAHPWPRIAHHDNALRAPRARALTGSQIAQSARHAWRSLTLR
ncbi:Site-specific recombinase XerD [Cupriavidus gilardii J11]|uniref:Site-specific recombinase XerD n=1 Tax=Cupriavidus gilardii J11 TaxID=936133 RepID=A0A562BV80_9BURK|nr:tyrosine-type recombinase/integrase [Cupriavidus gilardii]TWG89216.1 Site-specific recombinase XerD [Cupriavidus gilardii J11]